jgi:hypothetical protein
MGAAIVGLKECGMGRGLQVSQASGRLGGRE